MKNFFQVVDRWFNELVELSEEERFEKLSQLQQSATLTEEQLGLLSSMLQADQLHTFPEKVADMATNWDSADVLDQLHEQPVIGAYRLLKLLGSGGMGHVYLAARNDGSYEQQVAIKISQFHLNNSLVKRFENERQILAQLTHPNIAQLLDGGTAVNDQPYLVMEYVKGQGIDQYCIDQQLGLRARLQLMIQVCAAVSYAHQNLILHRDLKPANILVNQAGQVKLLDFGIAKLLSEDVDQCGQTMTRIMTRNYASPEQIKGEMVSTQSDLFSMAVIVYELVSGFHPFERNSELERDQNVVSGQIQSITDRSGNRQPLFPELTTLAADKLNGDLENILIKALSPEVNRRYGSVESFAEDLGNFIENRPVKARKLSFSYSLRKFIQRNTAAFLLVMFLSLGLVATTLFSIKKAHDAELQRMMAVKEGEQSRQISEFLTGVFTSAKPLSDKQELTARDLLRQGVEDIKTQLHEAPEERFELMAVMFDSMESLSYFETIFEYIDEVHTDCIQVLSADNKHCLSLLITAGESAIGVQQDELALTYLEEAEKQARLSPDTQTMLIEVLRIQFNAYTNLQRYDEAVASTEEALHYFKYIQPSVIDELNIYSDLAVLATHQEKYLDAKLHYESMAPIIEHSDKVDVSMKSRYFGNYSFLFIKQQKYQLAVEQRLKAIQIMRNAFDRPSFGLAWELESLAKTYFFGGYLEQGIRVAKEAQDTFKALDSEADKHIYELQLFIAEMQLLQGDFKKAAATMDGLKPNEWDRRCVFKWVNAMLSIQRQSSQTPVLVQQYQQCIDTVSYPTKFAKELNVLLKAEMYLELNDLINVEHQLNQLKIFWDNSPQDSLPLKPRYQALKKLSDNI